MIVSIALFACILLVAFLLASTITVCRSEKKNYFIFCLFAVLVYVLGSFLEVTSGSTGGALISTEVIYVGGCFISPFFLMFTLDYCEIRIRPAIITLLMGAPLVNLLLVLTTESTNLVYHSFEFSDDSPIHGLRIFEQGPLYHLFTVISIVCIVCALAILAIRFRSWGDKYRKTLVMLAIFSIAPLLSNCISIFMNYISNDDVYMFNPTAFVLVAVATAFYYTVLRYDLFDFTSRSKSMATDFSADAIIVIDADMKYSSANEAARKIFPGLVNVRKGSPVCDAEGWPEALTDIGTYIGAGKDFSEIEFDHMVDGEDRCYQASAKPFSASWQHEDTILGVVIIVHDVTTTHRLMVKLEETAATDGLTGLYNRRHFMEVAGSTLMRTRRMGTPCSILMLDLDKFKRVNDKYGHLAGDEVLRSVARQMKSTARIYDIFARYGGEEFVALIDGASLANAKQLAERIRKQVESSIVRYEDAGIKMTCSIGVAEAGEQDERIDDILRRADTALYKAKAEGRNRVCVSD